jgi:periplasmic protein TonB
VLCAWYLVLRQEVRSTKNKEQNPRVMSVRVALILILIFGTSAFAQSGRRKSPVAASTPTPAPEASPSPAPALPSASLFVTAEKGHDYRCTDDGTLAHLLDPPAVNGLSPKEVDVKAEVTAMPEPRYTPEARRLGVQGLVVLKVLLLPDGKIDRIRVVRAVPVGLTENAIFASCQAKFKPAMKGGTPVAQWVTLEFPFLLAHSSILGP